MTTQTPKNSVSRSAAVGRPSKGGRRGASRIPCPPQVVIPPQSLPFLAGLDFLKISLWLDWEDFWLLQTLQDRKAEFHDDKLSSPDASELPLRLYGDFSFNIQRSGAGRYPYVLKSGDVVLMFSNHNFQASFPNCRLEVGSISCWSPGWKHVYERILGWLRLLGAKVVQQKLSEFHLTADLPGVDFAESGLADVSRWITRSNKWGQHGEHSRPNYQSFGKGDMMLRCYDKTQELAQSPDSAKTAFFRDLWRSRLGHVPEHVTRIEFQIRRQVLRDIELDSPLDLEERLNAVWLYCTKEWCRFCATPLSESDRRNKNHQRHSTDVLWELVCSVTFSAAKVVEFVRKKVRHLSIEQLQRQAVGCLLAICGILGLRPDDLDSHLIHSFSLVDEQMRKNYKHRHQEYCRKVEVTWNNACLSV